MANYLYNIIGSVLPTILILETKKKHHSFPRHLSTTFSYVIISYLKYKDLTFKFHTKTQICRVNNNFLFNPFQNFKRNRIILSRYYYYILFPRLVYSQKLSYLFPYFCTHHLVHVTHSEQRICDYDLLFFFSSSSVMMELGVTCTNRYIEQIDSTIRDDVFPTD